MQTAKRNRFQLKGPSKAATESKAVAPHENDNGYPKVDPIVRKQQEKVDEMLDFAKSMKARDSVVQTEHILKAPVEDYEQIFTSMKPESSNPKQLAIQTCDAPTEIKNVQPKSLAEAQLLSRYQVLNVECQNQMGSVLPLIVETYRLQQLRKQTEAGYDMETGEHDLEKKVIAFSNAVQPNLAPIVQHCAKEFVKEAEEALLTSMQTDEIAEELESQELCLLKHDYLRDLKESIIDAESPKRKIVGVLETTNSAFPLQSQRSKIKQQAISRLIPTSIAYSAANNHNAIDANGPSMALQLSAKLDMIKQKALKRRQQLLEDL